MIANFYARFDKPKVPTRVFNDINDALSWIEENKNYFYLMTLSKKNEELNQFTLVEELGFAEIYLDDSKKVRMIKYLDNVVIDIEKAKKVVEVIYPFIVNGALYGMTDATAKNINVTPDTRKLYSSNKSRIHL